MATGGKTKDKRTRRAAGNRRSAGVDVEATIVPGKTPRHHAAIHSGPRHAPSGDPPSAADGSGPAAPPRRVRRGVAVRRLSRLAAAADDVVARSLEDLAATVAAGRRSGTGRDAVTAAVERCLGDGDSWPVPAARWTLCEGAAWALAWATGSQPTSGTESRVVARLGVEAAAAADRLRAGDPAAASFVVALAGLFPGVPDLRESVLDASTALARDITRSTDGDGGPATGPAAAFVSSVLAWTFAREAGLDGGHGLPWDDATEARFQAANVAALRLLGDKGAVPGSESAIDTRPLLDTLAASRRGTVRRTVAQLAGRGKADSGRTLPRDCVDPTGTVAVLRSDWGKGAVRVLLDFGRPLHHLEIAGGESLVISGDWGWSVEADGTPLAPTGPWEVCCFESDRKASFLEVAAPLPGGLQAERQIVLLPRDRVVILTDSVTDAGAGLPAEKRPDLLDYRGRLFLAGADAVAEVETREFRVGVGGRQWRLLPLALPEWRSGAAHGALEEDNRMLTLRHIGRGGRCSAPLWIDADPSRADRPLTWRQLTVADNRTNLQRHEAVGFRVQAGLEQWLLYRALDTPRNRTVLGCNVACEFLVGRIGRAGEVARTLEIE